MQFTRNSEGILEGGGRVIIPVLSEEDYVEEEVTLDDILAAEDSDDCQSQLYNEYAPARTYIETEVRGQGLEPGLILHGVEQNWFEIKPEYYGTTEGKRSKPLIGAPKIYVDYEEYRDKRENPMFTIEYDGGSDIELMVADGEYYDPDEGEYKKQWRRSQDLADIEVTKTKCKSCERYPHGYALTMKRGSCFVAEDRHPSELSDYPWGLNPHIDAELRKGCEEKEMSEDEILELMEKFAQ